MKKKMSCLVALALVLALALGTSGFASEKASEAFHLSGVTERPQTGGVTPVAGGSSTMEGQTLVSATDLAEPLKCIVNLDPSLEVRVRAEANSESLEMLKLKGGSLVDVIGIEGEWSKLALPDELFGYVPTMYLMQMPEEQVGTNTVSEPAVVPGSESKPESETTEAPVAEPTTVPIAVQPLPEPVKYRVNLDRTKLLDVYENASAASRLISQMYGEFEVDVIGTAGDWLQICLPDGMIGFSSAAYMTPVVPEATEAPKNDGYAYFVDEDGNEEEPDPTPAPTHGVVLDDAPEASETPAPETPVVEKLPQAQMYKVVAAAEVRASADANAQVIGRLAPGSGIEVTGIAGDWFEVSSPDGQIGYVPAACLTPPEDADAPAVNEAEDAADGEENADADADNEETLAPAPETSGEDGWYEVTANGLNVRVAPSADAKAVYKATKGYVFHVIGTEEGGWSKVLLPNGTTAYVKSEYLVKVDAPAGAQEAELVDEPEVAPTDETEAEPTDGPEAAPTEEPEAVPAEGTEAEQTEEPERHAPIRIDWADPTAETHDFGDEVVLSVDLSEYEGLDYDLQWQTGTTEDSYVDVPFATEPVYRTIVTKDNIMNCWRVEITTKDVAE